MNLQNTILVISSDILLIHGSRNAKRPEEIAPGAFSPMLRRILSRPSTPDWRLLRLPRRDARLAVSRAADSSVRLPQFCRRESARRVFFFLAREIVAPIIVGGKPGLLALRPGLNGLLTEETNLFHDAFFGLVSF